MFELKPLSKEAVPAALEKAMRYRLLNEPIPAESICRDVLAVDPENQDAVATLLLALTDQFPQRLGQAFAEAQGLLDRLADEYGRAYYAGIICERRGNAHHRRGGPGAGQVAYEWYRKAMEQYERAIEQRPPDNDDAILRWNTCVRILERHPSLKPAAAEAFHPLLE